MKVIKMNIYQERDLENLKLIQSKSYFAIKCPHFRGRIWGPLNNSTELQFLPLTSQTKRPLGNVVWHEASGTGFIGGLCHCIWEVLQSQPSCRRQHSNEVINNLQQLLRERDLIC